MGILHLVLISPDVDLCATKQLVSELSEAKAKQEINFDTISLSQLIAPDVKDGVLGGKIATGDTGAYILSVGLQDEQALSAYYEAPVHSLIRRRFCSAASQECAELYAAADAQPIRASAIFRQIETVANNFMQRIDFRIP